MLRVKSITCTLRALFSNEPKVIPKPAPLQFNFTIPNKSQVKKTSSPQGEVKIVKAKRSTDINKVLKKKKQGEQYKSKIQQAYQQQQQQKVQENLKTAKYLEQDYFKGEHLVQNIPLDPFYSYKLADFQRKAQMQQEKLKDFVSNFTDFDSIARTKFKMAELYHEKQQKYQVQEFLRYLDQYPGSPKGPKPEDDLDFYMQYARKKMPAILATQLAGKNPNRERVKKSDDDYVFKLRGENSFSSVMHLTRPEERPLEKDWSMAQQMDESSKFPIFKEHQQIPEIPQLTFNHYQQYMNDFINWKNFKNYYVQKHGENIIQKEMEFLFKVQSENDPEPENEFYTPRGKTPSLMRYYNTLPKSLQQHPGLKDIYLGLEYYCPYISAEEKEQLLNLACTKVLPLDKISKRAMNDFIEKKKEYLTPFMVDKIFSINPEYTWDIKQFFAEIKRQQLKGQSMIRQGESSYPQPPQVHLQWQEGAANLPVNYYENDDGFWDSIIQEKLKRQDEAKPMLKVRKHFYH